MSAMDLVIKISAINEATAALAEVAQSVERLQKMQRGFQDMGDRVSGVGRAMTRNLTLPIVAGLGYAAHAAIEFESAMADVNKAFGLQRGTAQAEAMSQQILQMSRELPYSAEGLAGIAASAGMLGVQQTQMRDFVGLVAQMGTAFDMSSDQAGDSIARLSNVFGYMDSQGNMNMQGLRGLGDTINYLADTGATSASDIVSAMTRVGGATRNFGLANNEAAALTTAFLNLGRPPEVVATAVSSMLPMLQAATRQTPKFQSALGELGLSAEGLERSIKTNASGALQDFFMRLSKVEDKTGVIQELFGSGSDSQLIASLAADTTQLTKAFDALGKVPAGGMMSEFQNRAATTANQMQLLKNNFNEFAINIGSVLLPAINGIAKGLQPMIQGLSSFAAKHPGITQVAVAFLGIVAVVGPLLVAIGSIISAIGSIAGAMAGLTAFAATGGLAAMGGAIASGLGVAASAAVSFVGALVGAAALVGILGAVAYGVVQIGAKMAGTEVTAQDFVNTITSSLQELPGNLSQVPAAIADSFSSAFTSVRMFFVGIGLEARIAIANISNAFSQIGSQIGMAFSTIGTTLGMVFAGIGATVMSFVTSIGTAFSGIGMQLQMVFANLGMMISTAFLPIQMAFANLGMMMTAAFMQIQMAVMNLGMMIQAGMMAAVAGIQAAWSGLIGFFAGIWAGIVGAAQSGIAAVVGAIQGGAGQAIGAIQSAGAGMIGAIQGIAGQMFAAGAAIISNLISGIMSMMGSAMAAVAQVGAAIRSALPGSEPKWSQSPLRNLGHAGGAIFGNMADGMEVKPVLHAMRSVLMPIQAIAQDTSSAATITPTVAQIQQTQPTAINPVSPAVAPAVTQPQIGSIIPAIPPQPLEAVMGFAKNAIAPLTNLFQGAALPSVPAIASPQVKSPDSSVSQSFTSASGDTYNFEIPITINGASAPEVDAAGDRLEERLKELLPRMLQSIERRNARVSYAGG
jgi:TP901 family phage tail tape measure protein